jgi:hypothetical protein
VIFSVKSVEEFIVSGQQRSVAAWQFAFVWLLSPLHSFAREAA